MKLSPLGVLLASIVVALCGVGMAFSLLGSTVLAGIFVGLSLASALALNAATMKLNRLTRWP